MPGTLEKQYHYCINCCLPLPEGARKFCSHECYKEYRNRKNREKKEKVEKEGPDYLEEYIKEQLAGKTTDSYGMWMAKRTYLPNFPKIYQDWIRKVILKIEDNGNEGETDADGEGDGSLSQEIKEKPF